MGREVTALGSGETAEEGILHSSVVVDGAHADHRLVSSSVNALEAVRVVPPA